MRVPRNIFVALLLFFACLLPVLEASAQVYKCKDPSGKISYSQSPCPDAVQERVVAAEGASDSFLKKLHAIARHGYLGDFEFVEKTLAIRIEPRPGRGRTRYELSPPSGSAASRMVYGFQPGPPGSGGFLHFSVDPARYCIPDAEVRGVFGNPQNDSMNGEDRELAFEIKGGPYTTAVFVTFVQRPAACARQFLLRVGYPSGSVRR